MTRIDRLPVWGLVALACVGAAGASSVPAGSPLALDDAIRIALERHPSLAAAGHEVSAAEAGLETARSGYWPRLDLVEDLARSTNPVFVFGGKLRQERFTMADFALQALNEPEALTHAATRVELRQSLWDGGRTSLGTKAATAGVDAGREQLARARQGIVYAASRAFWAVVLAEDSVGVFESAREAAVSHRDLAAKLLDEGMVVPSDLLSAEVRLAGIDADLAGARQQVTAARAALREALGGAPEASGRLEVPEILPVRRDESLEEAVGAALAARRDLGALDARIRQASVGEAVARSGRYPELGLGAAYELSDDTPFGTEGSNWTVGLSFRLPLFDGLETRGRLARARADSDRLSALRRAMEERVRLEVTAAWTARESAAQRIEAAERAEASAVEALRIVRDRYEEGMATVVELLGAEAALTGSRGAQVAAAHDLALASAALDLARGADAPTGRGEEGRP